MGRSNEKGGRTTGLEWGGPGWVGGAPRVPGEPRGCCSWQMRWPQVGAVRRLSLDVGSSRRQPHHAGAEPEDCALGTGA